MRKILASAIGALVVLTACSEPKVDPELQSTLETVDAASISSLIEGQAKALEITALTVTILDGDQGPQTFYFGRAHENGLMQVASMSKTVAATVILMLAEREGVDLDDDIRESITSLDVAALEGGDRPVTLRQLLSHTTGSSQSGYAGYPRDDDMPNTAQIISDPPRFFESALAFDGEPGEYRYSGGGYMIAQLWAEDVSGQRFDVLAEELLLVPLGLEQSTFAQPIEDADIAPLKIVGADAGWDPSNGIFSSIKDSWHNYPEQAAAGLWTTSADYSRYAAALLDAAAGEENAIPTTVAAAQIKSEITLRDEHAYGLGTQLVLNEDDSPRYVTHSGRNTGYVSLFSSRPATDRQTRRVVVSIANSHSGASLNEAVVFGLMAR